MLKSGKVTYDGKLNWKDFIIFLYNAMHILMKEKSNTSIIIMEIKSLIYKYYSSQ